MFPAIENMKDVYKRQDKRILAQEVLNYQRDAEYYKQQYEQEKARADRLAEKIYRRE